MQADEKYLNPRAKDEIQMQMVRMVMWTIFGVFFILILSISGCTMYSNSVEAEQIRATTEQIKEQTKIRKEKNDAIIELVEKGVNPIAARCAIMGYTLSTYISNPCSSFVNTNDKQITEE